MKFQVLSILLAGVLVSGYAQETDGDSVKVSSPEKKNRSIDIRIGEKSDSTRKTSSKFSFQLTLARLDLGLATFTENGSFTFSSPQAQSLEYHRMKTNNVGLELLQTGYRFNSYFKIYLAAGLDWTHMRLKKNITPQPDQPVFTVIEEDIDFKKNRFSSTYLRIPLSFQFRTKDDQKGNKFHFVAGPEIGFLLNGKTKQVSDERGKVKYKDDFNFNPFRYGAFARFGYDDIGLYVKYYANDVFADNQGPKDFKNLSFGLMLGF